MKCIGFYEKNKSFVILTRQKPLPAEHEILVEIKAISVNPIDYKLRDTMVYTLLSSSEDGRNFKVLGFDASGVVESVGENVQYYKKGDEVYYSGNLSLDGTNATHHLVNEFIVGKKPKNLSFLESAAIHLTTLSAYEGLFDRLNIDT